MTSCSAFSWLRSPPLRSGWCSMACLRKAAFRPAWSPSSRTQAFLVAISMPLRNAACDPKEALHKLRTMTGWYTHGLENGRALRVRISGLATPVAFREAVQEFFDRPGVSAESLNLARPEFSPDPNSAVEVIL